MRHHSHRGKEPETLGDTLRRVLQEVDPDDPDGRTHAETVVQAMIDNAKAGNLEAREAVRRMVVDSIKDGTLGAVITVLDRAGVSVRFPSSHSTSLRLSWVEKG